MHTHHILPKHVIEWNDAINLVEVDITTHAEFHRYLWETFNYYEDYIAWRALSGIISCEETIREAQAIGGRKNKGKKPKNKSLFKKGNVPWNKEKKGLQVPWNKGLKDCFTQEQRDTISIKQKKRMEDLGLRQYLRELGKKQWERGKGILPPTQAGTIWINNGTKHKRIKKEDLIKYSEWYKGRLIPQNQLLAMQRNRTTTKDPVTGRFTRREGVTSR
jgi:hypothetical protein